MDYRRLGNTLVVRIDRGEEITSELARLCQKENITLAEIRGLGALSEMEVGVYDVARQQFIGHTMQGSLEITSLWGTVTQMNGQPYLHLHLSAGDKDGHVFGGHLKKAIVGATSELIVDLIDGHVGRVKDEDTGLNIFSFD